MPLISTDEYAKPHLFKIVKGVRIENQFYFECQTSYSHLRTGYIGHFGFKDGVQTMEGRVIDSVDQEKEYILLKQDSWKKFDEKLWGYPLYFFMLL